MTPEITNHLSEEALDDVLIGLGSPESHAHLAACAECRGQVEAFRSDVRLFNAASIAWSDSRPAREQRPALQRRPAKIPFASWTAVAAALVIMAFAIWHHRPAVPPDHANTVQPQPVDTEAQILQDNQLLQAVNAAISPDDESPIDEYKIMESTHAHSKAHSNKRVK